MFHVEHGAEISELLAEGAPMVGCKLNDEAISKFIIYFNELTFWNSKVNLTGLTQLREIVVSLFIDSLACGKELSAQEDLSILDVGSGGGFPGIPLKIAYPGLKMTLVEPRLKKTAFLRHIVGTLGLGEVDIVSGRIEDLVNNKAFRGKFDHVVSRAIRPDSILPIASWFLKDSGQLILFRSKPSTGLGDLGRLTLVREVDYNLPYAFGGRVLSILKPVPGN